MNDEPEVKKSEIQSETVNSINKYNRPAKSGLLSLPYQLPALLALLPAYITYRLVVGKTTQAIGLIIVLAVFSIFQIGLGFYFRSLLRKHPDLKWQILIR